MKHFTLLCFIIISPLILSACGTAQGLQRDFIINRDKLIEVKENWNKDKQEDTAVTHQEPTIAHTPTNVVQSTHSSIGNLGSNGCPPIYIDPTLSTLTEFKDMGSPSSYNEVSHIELKSTNQDCIIENGYINMRIDLNFEGRLGPKARVKSNDRPFFAYPYFIAITDSVQVELAKEIFAASVSYEDGKNSILLVETIRQRLPLNPDGTMPAYNVNIGFQLTEDQLFYNTSR